MGSSSLNSSSQKIFDEIRQVWVVATPEELVRQKWLKRMIAHLHYPKELLVVEKQISGLPHLLGRPSLAPFDIPDRRLDILCYAKQEGIHPLVPLLLVECKQDLFTDDAVNQVIGYNHYVGACFIAVVNLRQVQFGCFDVEKNKYVFCSFLPSFKELMQWLKR